jgi:eukaryotic-like serine/threonine-protein kinase
VLTCLAKDPAERWQSVRELKHALAWAARPATPSARTHRGMRVAAVAAAVLVIVSGAGVLLRRGEKAPRAQPVRFPITLPPNTQMTISQGTVSPDGRRIALTLAFLDKPGVHLLLRELDALVPTAVPGGESGYGPFWSPDSRTIALWGATGLRRLDLAGGPARIVCGQCRKGGGLDYGASWGTTDVIVYSDVGKLFRVPAEGGEPQLLGDFVPGETGRFWPRFLPDGRHYLYLSLASRPEDRGIYVGALGSDLRRRIVATEYAAAYSPPGYLVYIKDEALVAQPFDAERLALSGEPLPILDEEVARVPGMALAGRAQFSVSSNGVLVWRPGPLTEVKQLTWFDRAGRKLGTLGEPGRYISQALSPDEKSVAACRQESASNRDIWILDAASGGARRLTFDPHDDCDPAWSPDGTRIAFFSDRRGVREIYQKRVDGSGDDELLVASQDIGLQVESWSSDGRFLSYKLSSPGSGGDILVLPLSRPREASPVRFLATPASESFGALAPNGRYLAYHSDESGKVEVYVREVTPQGQPGPGKWQISNGAAGLHLRWRADGRELLFFGTSSLMAVGVQTDGPAFRFAAPRPLGIRRGEQIPASFGLWGVSRHGQRFLFGVPVQPPEPIRVLVNWLPVRG